MIPFLLKQFQTSTFVHRNEFQVADLEEQKPDIVVYQVVARDIGILHAMESR